MAEEKIGEGQAKDQIQICDTELKKLKSAGVETSDIENVLRIAHSFFLLGVFDKSFQFAGSAYRMIEEKRKEIHET